MDGSIQAKQQSDINSAIKNKKKVNDFNCQKYLGREDPPTFPYQLVYLAQCGALVERDLNKHSWLCTVTQRGEAEAESPLKGLDYYIMLEKHLKLNKTLLSLTCTRKAVLPHIYQASDKEVVNAHTCRYTGRELPQSLLTRAVLHT